MRHVLLAALLTAHVLSCAPGPEPAPASTPVPAQEPVARPVDFNRDIRPLLADACIACHGPDPKHREAGLRLDTPEGILGEFEPGKRALVPKDRAKSLLWARITTKDRDDLMPPPKSGKKLTPAQLDLVGRWIDQGAEVRGHWAFSAPVPPSPLPLRGWGVNEIDAFVAERLGREGLRPSPAADPRTLARRVALDLTGLPPTPEEADAFAADPSPRAYEAMIDRLLASPRYGEHMARYWLDLARYGDTHGLHLDNYREIWPYRDWVVRAFQSNLPFDRFVREQVAGDLLPNATLDQQIASGFNRCHVTTSEGGSIEEEVHCRNVFDRVETFGQVFFALTLACARCHDHKYDPVTQKEYYGLFAFFNSLDGPDMDGNRKDTPPTVKVPDPSQAAELAALRAKIGPLEAAMNGPDADLDARQRDWESGLKATLAAAWIPLEAKAVGLAEVSVDLPEGGALAIRVRVLAPEGKDPAPFAATAASLSAGEKAAKLRTALLDAPGNAPQAALVDGKPDSAWSADARKAPAVVLIPEKPLAAGPLAVKLTLKAAVPGLKLEVSATTSKDLLRGGTPSTRGPWHLLGRFEEADGAAAFAATYGPERGVDLAADVRGKKWERKDDFADGKDLNYPGGVGASFAYRVIESPSARRITFTAGSDDALQVWLNGVLVLSRNVKRTFRRYDENKVQAQLQAGENRLLLKFSNYGTSRDHKFRFEITEEESSDLLGEVAAALEVDPSRRSDAQASLLRTRFRREHSPAWREASAARALLLGQETALLDGIPSTLVFKERGTPRDAFVLKRGEYDRRGEKVARHTPSVLPPLPKDAPLDRLGLADWLLAPSHPLTARVAVNRFWQQIFGVGLVKTSEDFGITGEAPVHPDLLDALATGFRADGWNVQRLLKRILLSSTYRQSSRVTPELARRDPENRLLARGPRFRMDAETVRDQVLYLSGLLVEQVGGPGVKPPQPEGLWEAVGYTGSNTYRFKRDAEPGKVFRRSLYIFWKRTSAPPMLTVFDAPSRESCIARRERTNTPLQALLMMNEPQVFEASRHLAQKALKEGGVGDADRAAWMLRRCTQRPATAADVADLVALVAAQRSAFAAVPGEARKVVTFGDLPPDPAIPEPELAAWTMAANLVLNLDEVLVKR